MATHGRMMADCLVMRRRLEKCGPPCHKLPHHEPGINHHRNSRAVLLDRDGTVIEDRHYLSDPSGVALLPGAAAGLAALAPPGRGCSSSPTSLA